MPSLGLEKSLEFPRLLSLLTHSVWTVASFSSDLSQQLVTGDSRHGAITSIELSEKSL